MVLYLPVIYLQRKGFMSRFERHDQRTNPHLVNWKCNPCKNKACIFSIACELWNIHLKINHASPVLRLAFELMIASHTNAAFNLEDISNQVNLSTRRLEQLFREEFNCTFNEYLRTLRVVHAIYLVDEKPYLYIKEIYYQVGFINRRTYEKARREFENKCVQIKHNP
jgi:AraC-like DNA-binding protein